MGILCCDHITLKAFMLLLPLQLQFLYDGTPESITQSFYIMFCYSEVCVLPLSKEDTVYTYNNNIAQVMHVVIKNIIHAAYIHHPFHSSASEIVALR